MEKRWNPPSKAIKSIWNMAGEAMTSASVFPPATPALWCLMMVGPKLPEVLGPMKLKFIKGSFQESNRDRDGFYRDSEKQIV